MSSRLQLVVVLAAAVAVAWVVRWPAGRSPVAHTPGVVAEREGLILHVDVSAVGGGLVANLIVENRRGQPVFLKPSQCGAVGRVALERARPEPTGRTWTGSVQAVKRRLVLETRAPQPERFWLRRTGECQPSSALVRVAAHSSIGERWELPYPYTLDAVGSAGAVVRASIAEGESWLGELIGRGTGDDWLRWLQTAGDAMLANDAGATELAAGHGANLVMFTTGSADGGYPMFVGLDARGRPTRFVLDFFVVHFRWP